MEFRLAGMVKDLVWWWCTGLGRKLGKVRSVRSNCPAPLVEEGEGRNEGGKLKQETVESHDSY